MCNMGDTEKQLRSLLENSKKSDSFNNEAVKEFEKSVKDFQKLIADGVTKPRGYNLLTIEDRNPILEFNSMK